MDQPSDPQQTQQSNPTPGPPSAYSRRDRSNSPRRTTRYSPPRDSYSSRPISRVPPRSLSPHRSPLHAYPSHRDDRGYPRDDNRGYSHHRDDRGYDRGGYRDEPPRSAYRDDRRGMYEGRGGYAADRDRGGYDRSSGGGYPSGPAYSGSAPRGGYGSGPRGSGHAGSAGRGRRPVDRGSDTDRRDSTTIYVGNLPYSFRERDVADLFERYGHLRKVTVLMDNYTSRNKGFAFVEFEERRDAEDAFEMYSGYSVDGRRLKLDWDIGMVKKDAHRGRGSSDYQPPPGPTANSDPYVRDAPPPPRGYSPNYQAGGRSPSPYRR